MIADYVSVFSAIVLGLAVSDLALSFHKLMRHRSRVRWDVLPLTVAVMMLLVLIAFWWASFMWYRGVEKMTIADYLPDLANLLLVFLATAAILPDEVPADGINLREFYFSISSYFWTLWVILMVLVITVLGPRYLPNVSWKTFLIEELDNFLFLVGAIILTFTKRYWVHAVIVVPMLATVVWQYLPRDLA